MGVDSDATSGDLEVYKSELDGDEADVDEEEEVADCRLFMKISSEVCKTLKASSRYSSASRTSAKDMATPDNFKYGSGAKDSTGSSCIFSQAL